MDSDLLVKKMEYKDQLILKKTHLLNLDNATISKVHGNSSCLNKKNSLQTATLTLATPGYLVSSTSTLLAQSHATEWGRQQSLGSQTWNRNHHHHHHQQQHHHHHQQQQQQQQQPHDYTSSSLWRSSKTQAGTLLRLLPNLMASRKELDSKPKIKYIWGFRTMVVLNNHGFFYYNRSSWGGLGVPPFKETPI